MNFYRHVPRLLGGGLGRAYDEAEEIRRRDPIQGTFALALLFAHEKKNEAAFAALEEVMSDNADALCRPLPVRKAGLGDGLAPGAGNDRTSTMPGTHPFGYR